MECLIFLVVVELEVQVELKKMLADNYHIRASARCQKYPHILRIEHYSKNHSSLEVRNRCHIQVKKYFNIGPRNYDKYPWLADLKMEADNDAYGTHNRLVKHYVEAVQGKYGISYWDYSLWREATKLYVEDLLRNGADREKVMDILDELVERERNYQNTNKINWR